MNMNDLILVAGGTGGVGRAVVEQLKAEGRLVRVLARDAARARDVLGAVDIVQGDTRDPQSLAPALQGVRYVVCATGSRDPAGPNSPQAVDYQGVSHLVAAARQAGVEHFVLVSTIFATRHDHPLNNFGQVLTWKLKGEDALRASGLTYTIVRPGGLTDEPAGQRALVFDQGDRISGRTARADVARVCIEALRQPQARNVTFEVVETEGAPRADLGSLFENLQTDAGL